MNKVEREGKSLRRVGGIAALALGAGYVLTIPLYIHAGAPPTGAEAWLKYLSARTAEWWIILGLSVATDFLFVPVALALFSALKSVSRDFMLVGTALVLMFVVLDLAVTWTNYASLITLSGQYASATDASQRATYIAAASYPASILASHLEAVYAIGVPSVGILLIGFAMLSGGFGRVPAYVGMAAGGFGIVAVSGWSPAVIVTSTLTTIWILLVGYRLLRPG